MNTFILRNLHWSQARLAMEPEAFLRAPVGGDAEASWGLSAAAEGAGFMMA